MAGVRLMAGLTLLLCRAWGADAARPSPPFTILRQGAPNIDIKHYRGKVVVLAFIFTTCPHCQSLTRSLSALAREFSGKPVQFLECAFNDDVQATLPEFLATFQPPYPVGWSYRGSVRAYLNIAISDGRFMVPHLVFLDRRGTVRLEVRAQDAFFQDTDANIRAELNQLLGSAPPVQ